MYVHTCMYSMHTLHTLCMYNYTMNYVHYICMYVQYVCMYVELFHTCICTVMYIRDLRICGLKYAFSTMYSMYHTV
jgi:hypothetical protein